MTVLALLGVKALYLLYVWMASGIAASYLSRRKGYGERVGLATGLVLSALGVLVWLLWPARPESSWKTEGILRRRGRARRSH